MTGHLVQHCDEDPAAQLEAEGWTIDRNALAHTHHGHYRPHYAWRLIETSGAEPGQQQESADTPPGILTGAALPPLVPPEDVSAAIACLARNERCPVATYCRPEICRKRGGR